MWQKATIGVISGRYGGIAEKLCDRFTTPAGGGHPFLWLGGEKNGITAAVKIQADCSQVSDPGKAILEQQRNKNKSKPIGDAAGRRAGALRNELYPKP